MSSDPTLTEASDAHEWEDCPEAEDEWIVMDVNGFSVDSIKDAARAHGGLSLIGLDSEEPILKIGNMHFRGVFDNSLGSDMIFATSSNAVPEKSAKDIVPTPPRFGLANAMFNMDFNKDNTTTLTYMGKTETHIKFSRIRLEPKPVVSATVEATTPTVSPSAPTASGSASTSGPHEASDDIMQQ
ncbi:hypothetical protein BCR33DRAFT_714217 [Rhizoclosmatium globosum]|uniref:Transcription factor TFIIIC triple barrel domain-containing protein n=1 Tax=Rhizoclosmatium globosum TaxID=329046 RepID=A0A1Y2CQ89_9FUNG|nr:hypothetical protein BCR33DRAFT_714217 [Rhizoclosmatium globosum]|eukprot:ORY49190.1 hypothetical protein BCR33DRAFT_714217 [Rhizoclosmatium globosum]